MGWNNHHWEVDILLKRSADPAPFSLYFKPVFTKTENIYNDVNIHGKAKNSRKTKAILQEEAQQRSYCAYKLSILRSHCHQNVMIPTRTDTQARETTEEPANLLSHLSFGNDSKNIHKKDSLFNKYQKKEGDSIYVEYCSKIWITHPVTYHSQMYQRL